MSEKDLCKCGNEKYKRSKRCRTCFISGTKANVYLSIQSQRRKKELEKGEQEDGKE